jgi:AcrR family transcriptional regulator
MGTRERRRREAQMRRQEILSAARRVFWREGYSRATIPQIAREAEYATGTIYLYFPSKDALYVELLGEGYDLLLERLEEQAARPGEPQERAGRLIEAFFDFAREHPPYFDAMFFIIRREFGVGWEENFVPGQVESILAREQACKEVAGRLLRDVLPDPAADTSGRLDAIWSMLAGVVFYFRNRKEFAEVAQTAKAMILSAVFAETTKGNEHERAE